MNKKTKLSLAIALSLSVLSVSYIYADSTIVKKAEISANFMSFENIDDLYNDSDLVVKAVATEKSSNILNKVDGFTSGYTLTDIKIDKVIKGDKNLKDTVFQVGEPTYTVDNGILPGITRLSYEEYTPMKSGSQYILFIKKSGSINWVNSLYQGKFNISNSDAEEKNIQNKNYQNLKDQVSKKADWK